jgi:hypothetical protein
MSIITDQLVITQGASFKKVLACTLADLGIGDISVFASGPNKFTLSRGLRGDTNFKSVGTGTLTFSVNNVTLLIDEAVTDLITDLEGSFSVRVSNGPDVWRIAQGGWTLNRDTA